MLKPSKLIAGVAISTVILFGSHAYASNPSTHTVRAGDSLWAISRTYGLSVDQIKSLNSLTSDTIYVGQTLQIGNTYSQTVYTVKSGDTLWGISRAHGVSVDNIRKFNNLTSDVIFVGQKLYLTSNSSSQGSTNNQIKYTVKSGDSLWRISNTYGATVQSIRQANNLVSDTIFVGQVLTIPTGTSGSTPSQPSTPQAVTSWPSVTYIVQTGDSASTIAQKFGMSTADILRYNYKTANDWFSAGEKIAISGYAPRQYTVFPGESSAPARVGKLVDWFLEGKYLIKRNDIFLLTDVVTGKQFRVKMMGGYNHSDVEPVSASDTAVMREIFGNSWTWSPRAVVIFKDGMNIAASLSGMPHGANTVTGNNVTGHFDLYLKNSLPHNTTTSAGYINQHYQMVQRAAGK